MTVLDYIENRPDKIKEWMYAVRDMVFESAPEAKESLKWSLPFYSHPKNDIFLHPKKDHLIVAFLQGKVMSEQFPSPFWAEGNQKPKNKVFLS